MKEEHIHSPNPSSKEFIEKLDNSNSLVCNHEMTKFQIRNTSTMHYIPSTIEKNSLTTLYVKFWIGICERHSKQAFFFFFLGLSLHNSHDRPECSLYEGTRVVPLCSYGTHSHQGYMLCSSHVDDFNTRFERLQRSSSLRNAFEHPKGDVFLPSCMTSIMNNSAKGLLTNQKFTHFYVLGHKMPHLHLPSDDLISIGPT